MHIYAFLPDGYQVSAEPSVVYRNWKSIVHADTSVSPSNISWGQSTLNRDILCFWFRFFYCPKQALQSFLLVTIFMWSYTSQHQQLAGVVKELISDHRDPLPCQEDCQCRRCLRLCSLSLLGSACSFLRKKSCNRFKKVGVCYSACSFLKLWLCAVGWFIGQRIRRVNDDQLLTENWSCSI